MWKNSFKKTNREQWLDIAKFFGILLVVLNHMEINIPIITYLGGMFYMPLFFVAAGYTYRKKEETFGSFAAGKAKRLLIPYTFCNLVLFAFFTLKNRAFDKWAFLGMFYSRNMLLQAKAEQNIILMPNLNAPTWFLTCIFVCYCIYFLIDRKYKDTVMRRKAVLSVMAVGVILRSVSPVLLPWSLENAMFFLGLLETGRFLKEEGLAWLRSCPWMYIILLAGFIGLSYIQGSVNVSISEYGCSMVLYFFTAVSGSILCMKLGELIEKYLKLLTKPLAFIGRHTMPVLCWHLLAIEILKKILPIPGM